MVTQFSWEWAPLTNWFFSLLRNKCRFCPSSWALVQLLSVLCLLYLKGVGDNSQGTVNAVLFCFLTRAVRIRIWRSLKKLYVRICCCGKNQYSDKYIHSPAENDSFYWPATSYEALNSWSLEHVKTKTTFFISHAHAPMESWHFTNTL